MLNTICLYFTLFIIYAFLGWLMETIYCYFCTKKLVDRGFLIGPVCPIYGLGCLGIIVLLRKYHSDPLVLFVLAMIICSFLEYFTSYLMEKLFKARWWDYSDKKFNINGRICLENIVAFGVLGLLLINFINPFILSILNKINVNVLNIISIVIFVIFLVDNIISFKVISGFKKVAKSIKKDSTEEITTKVRELLTKKGGLYRRLVSAFNFQASEKLLKNISRKVKENATKALEFIDNSKDKLLAEKDEVIKEYKKKYADLKKKFDKEIKNIQEQQK